MTDPPATAPRRVRRAKKASTNPGVLVAPFEVRGSGALNWLRVRRRWVWVELSEGILRVTARPDRVHTIPVAGIRRILAGTEPHRSATAHRLEIWPEHGRSIILTAFAGYPEMPGYAALLRGLAVEAERNNALDRMRLGLPRRHVFGLPLLAFVCLFGSIWFASASEGNGPKSAQDFLLMALVILGLVLIPTAWTLRQGFHRRVRTPADLDRLLGPG